MSDDEKHEPDAPKHAAPHKDLEDPDAELRESDAGGDHLPGESYRNTLRLN